MSKSIKAISLKNITYSVGKNGFKSKKDMEYEITEDFFKKHRKNFILNNKKADISETKNLEENKKEVQKKRRKRTTKKKEK